MATESPFHAGEIEAQRRAGVGDVASQVAGFIRNYLPEQHREFHTSLPFLVISAADADDQPWVTILEGEDGFVTSPSDTSLEVRTDVPKHDPLAAALHTGTDIGLLGIEFATRRRNRLSGFVRWLEDRYVIDVRQTFGNCPQYIHQREWYRAAQAAEPTSQQSDRLSDEQIQRIGRADTMFIGTGQQQQNGALSNGYDASHRGGEPGFVKVIDRHHLQIPDYAGNNFFNTIGNILRNPKVGLLFVDFVSGDLLHVTGRAKVDWDPVAPRDPGALRIIDVEIISVLDRPNALSLRWSSDASPLQNLTVARKEKESAYITSFYLVPTGDQALRAFEPGQHLPIHLEIPGQPGRVQRSYSLSGPANQHFYRLSVKREAKGIASRFLHDSVDVGDTIRANQPAGDFVIPCGNCPLVLASAGVGLTPMLSMMHATIREANDRPVWFMHGARDGRKHAMRAEIEQIVATADKAQARIYYSQPAEVDQLGTDYDIEGRITAKSLLALNAGPDAHYLLCGPASFVSSLESGLASAGVAAGQIHFETF